MPCWHTVAAVKHYITDYLMSSAWIKLEIYIPVNANKKGLYFRLQIGSSKICFIWSGNNGCSMKASWLNKQHCPGHDGGHTRYLNTAALILPEWIWQSSNWISKYTRLAWGLSDSSSLKEHGRWVLFWRAGQVGYSPSGHPGPGANRDENMLLCRETITAYSRNTYPSHGDDS